MSRVVVVGAINGLVLARMIEQGEEAMLAGAHHITTDLEKAFKGGGCVPPHAVSRGADSYVEDFAIEPKQKAQWKSETRRHRFGAKT